jgi:uncharacterized membrane protein
MSQRDFWGGFGAGASVGVLAGLGAAIAWRAARSGNQDSDVLRLEKTVQIGRPVSEVFRAWSELENLPNFTGMIKRVRPFGRRSHWVAEINGKTFEWDAELIQVIPNQALGWKSASGPKHTGRISFAPLGDNTLVHVQMNYAPPLGAFGRAVLETFDKVDQYIEQALRDFKSALEGKGQEGAEERATGTFGGGSGSPAGRPVDTGVTTPPSGGMQTSRFGNQQETVEYTRPPEAKS